MDEALFYLAFAYQDAHDMPHARETYLTLIQRFPNSRFIPNAFLSLAYKPEPGTFVTLEELEALHDLCVRADDPGSRCTMIHALFDFGEITQGSFSPAVATFQGP